MPVVVAGEAQHEVAGAFLFVAVEPFRRRCVRSRESGVTVVTLVRERARGWPSEIP